MLPAPHEVMHFFKSGGFQQFQGLVEELPDGLRFVSVRSQGEGDIHFLGPFQDQWIRVKFEDTFGEPAGIDLDAGAILSAGQ